MTLDQLKAIMPRAKHRADTCFASLCRAMAEFEINTPMRKAAFLAQLAHESGQLRYFEELADGKAYEGRRALGNTQPGDGPRFKGRGPIQLTGRANYGKAGLALGIDLLLAPEKAAEIEVGCRIAGWFWQTKGLNELADKSFFEMITKRINGGLTHLRERREFYTKALSVLLPKA